MDENLTIPQELLLKQTGLQTMRIWKLEQENAELKAAVEDLAKHIQPPAESTPEEQA